MVSLKERVKRVTTNLRTPSADSCTVKNVSLRYHNNSQFSIINYQLKPTLRALRLCAMLKKLCGLAALRENKIDDEDDDDDEKGR